MSLQGDLEFRDANKITFIGGSSNTLIDLTTGSLGVGVTGTSLSSNLHVAGNKIKVGDNIFSTDGPHARLPKEVPLKKYPEIIFESGKFDSNDSTNTYVQAGYTVTASSSNAPTYSPIKAFNGIISGDDAWTVSGSPYQDETGSDPGAYNAGTYSTTVLMPTSTSIPGEYIQIKLPNKIKPTKFGVASYSVGNDSLRQPNSGVFAGSNDGTTWYKLVEYSNETTWTRGAFKSFIVTDNIDTTYEYIRFIIRRVGNPEDHTGVTLSDGSLSIHGLELYGYEEDPPAGDTSVDTTFASIMNTPQTTGANVYVDAKLSSDFTNQVSGPTPVGTAAVHDNINKYWELTGALTSNITVEANTFLEGDQPHAVSVWFNSSNLEANVSNTCVFSVSDQEHLNSQNLNLQSNTWHNLTYAYQGEGGSRVAYLDGRKVAEDQAEDTFGAYPPFDMTGYSQGGYVVSASSEHDNGVRLSWKAFESGTGNESGLFMFNETGPKYGPTANTNAVLFEGVHGEWIKLKLPEKIYINYLFLRGSQGGTQSPEQIRILGSNDDVNWDVVKDTFTVSNPAGDSNDAINSAKAYKYIVLQVIKVNGSNAVQIKQILYYGHRENDLVRLPDPTNVLKYPHIAMTGPAQRGYVASSNNEYTVDGRLAWKAYDAFDLDSGENAWMTKDPSWTTATPGEPIGTGDNAPDTFTVGGVDYTGHWNKLELPHKIRVSQIYMSSRMSDRLPYKGVFLGSDNDSSWEVIYSFNNTLTWSAVSGVGQATTITGITNTNSYKYVMLVVQQINGSDYRLWLNEIKYYGTGVDSVPIQIGGGNIDKVANFRVYDKFIGEDQALEIWDAQKDTFRGVKNSVTLHKGRLGIGTTEPEGRLVVAD